MRYGQWMGFAARFVIDGGRSVHFPKAKEPGMQKKLIVLPALFSLLSTPARAEFFTPTRNPNAPECNASHPAALVPEQIVADSFG